MNVTVGDQAQADARDQIARLTRRVERERAARIEAERIAEAATRSSIEDPLTKLANRTRVTAELEREIQKADRYGHDVALLFLDLDGFKLVNDTYGHEAGDEILLSVAEALRSTTRAADTVGRIGGDEFMIVAPDTSREDAAILARRVAFAIEEVTSTAPLGLSCRASIGVAMHTGAEIHNASDYVRRADAAMYAAKTAGTPVRMFDSELSRVADTSRMYRRELPRALANGELIVHHQPIVRLHDHRFAAFEALVRWSRPDGTVVGPNEFIPVAEEDGQIVELGQHVARTAGTDLLRWRERTLDEDCLVMINTSPRELGRVDYAHHLTMLTTELGLPSTNIVVEMTESSLTTAGRRADETLRTLRRMGFRTALDDFGAGNSSIGRLRNDSFDVLKIDRSFVAGVEEREADRTVVAAIVAIANAFGIEAIAQGVETEAQLRIVTELGCHAAQGWHFAHAAPIDEFDSPDQFVSG